MACFDCHFPVTCVLLLVRSRWVIPVVVASGKRLSAADGLDSAEWEEAVWSGSDGGDELDQLEVCQLLLYRVLWFFFVVMVVVVVIAVGVVLVVAVVVVTGVFLVSCTPSPVLFLSSSAVVSRFTTNLNFFSKQRCLAVRVGLVTAVFHRKSKMPPVHH